MKNSNPGAMAGNSQLELPDEERRDFLYITTGTMAAVGGAAAVWPLIDSMNPSAAVTAVSSIEVDISSIDPGQRITVVWRGKPVFIDHRTSAQIAKAQADDGASFIDQQRDDERVQRAEWLVVVGICTHLGCVPLGQGKGEPLGEWDGWFCPCHGSHYDTSGRIRKGPAPRNLEVPPYTFVGDAKIRIGS